MNNKSIHRSVVQYKSIQRKLMARSSSLWPTWFESCTKCLQSRAQINVVQDNRVMGIVLCFWPRPSLNGKLHPLPRPHQVTSTQARHFQIQHTSFNYVRNFKNYPSHGKRILVSVEHPCQYEPYKFRVGSPKSTAPETQVRDCD